MERKSFSVKLNNKSKIEQLLQETYDLACQQYTQIQEEINKIANSTKLKDLEIDGKEKYAKAMNAYLTLQQKTTAQKFDIAKLLAEVLKHNGDVLDAIEDVKKAPTTLDLGALRQLAKDASTQGSSDETQVYYTKN